MDDATLESYKLHFFDHLAEAEIIALEAEFLAHRAAALRGWRLKAEAEVPAEVE